MTPRFRRAIVREFTRIARAYARLAEDKARRETGELVRWIRPRADEKVLDAACGPGTLARAVARRGARVWAVDLCPSMLRAAREGERHRASYVHLTLSDVEQLPYAAQTFDLVICANSFANFPRPLRVLRELARVARNGGRVFIVDLLAPEDPAQCASLNRLEALRGRLYTKILRRSEFLDFFRQAGLRLESLLVGKRRRDVRDWLRLSPAAANPRRARKLKRLLLESIHGDKAGLEPRRIRGDIVFHPTTGWFLLRRASVPRGESALR